jgi:TolB-like protein
MSERPSFFAELKRRHVYRVAVAYAVAGWLLIQFATQVFPVFSFPNWTSELVVLLIAIGFPIALILAWAFELTPEGLRRTEPAHSPDARPEEHARHVGKRLNWLIIAVLAVIVAVLLADRFAPRKAATAGAAPGKSVAVLPFESLSEDKANAYFATGMQDEILTRLAGIRDLKVISRTSTEQYGSHPPNLKIVAEQLGVSAVLEGSVQKAGDSAHINVQLIEAPTDSHLWAESYDRELKDIFGVERDIAQKVAEALRATLLPEEAERVARVPTQDTDAYDLYLRALAYSNRANDQYGMTSVVMPQAIDLLGQALAKDPKFALAAALLGRAHMYLYWFGPDRTDERLAAAKQAAEQALRLQPDLGEGHFALAFYWYWGFHDYAKARQELDLARNTISRSFDVESLSAAISRRQGNWDEALEGLRRSAALDPRNASMPFEFGQTYAQLRRYAEADQAYAHAAELSADPALSQIRRGENTAVWRGDVGPLRAALSALTPGSDAFAASRAAAYELAWLSRDFAGAAKIAEQATKPVWTNSRGNVVFPVRLRQAWAYTAMGDEAKARDLYAEIRKDYTAKVQERPGDWDRHLALGFADAGLGLKAEAVSEAQRAAELLPISRDAFAGPELLACVADLKARVGDKDGALALLQQLLGIPAGIHVSPALLKLDPVWDSLRSDPRFQKLANAPDGGADRG